MVNIASVEVLVAGMAGMALMFVFTGLAMAAVGVTAQEVVTEVCLVLCVCVCVCVGIAAVGCWAVHVCGPVPASACG